MSNPNPVGSWKPGQSGNPNGRPPKDRSISEILEKYGDIEDDEGLTKKEKLIKMMWELAIQDKDMPAAKYILDRILGKPTETIKQEIRTELIEIDIEEDNE